MARTGEIIVLFSIFQLIWTKSIRNEKKFISEECRLYNICEHVDDYPTELAQRLIAKLKSQGTIFDNEEPFMPEITLSSRMGSDSYENSEGTNLCKTKTKIYIPKIAVDVKNITRKILNDDKNPTYRLNVEICLEAEPQLCNDALGYESPFPLGYKGKCIQMYKLRPLHYLQGNDTEIGNFKIPTSCVCGMTYI